jgi:S1-C subfamily serine protease
VGGWEVYSLLTMSPSAAVLVRVTGPDPKSMKTQHRSFFAMEAGQTSLSCSGFLCANNLVVTSAWLLAPFVREDNRDELISGAVVDMCAEDGVWRPCTLERVCSPPNFVLQTLQALALNPSLPVVRSVDLCALAVLTCLVELPSEQLAVMDSFVDLKAEHRGLVNLTVVSSAFGLVSPEVFRNCVTQGVLSNVVGRDGGCVLLTDARCLPGSEGGMVLDRSSGALVGMVLPGVQRADATFVELGCILPARYVVSACGLVETVVKRELAAGLSPLLLIGKQVGLVQVGTSWGSGVVVGSDLVVTCAHVVRPAMHEDGDHLLTQKQAVWVSFNAAPSISCKVVFCSQGPVDLALLQIEGRQSLSACNASRDTDAVVGESVVAVGHAIFEPSGPGGQSSTASLGTLARVIRDLNGVECMYQSSCLVYRGHSGGLLADNAGRALGVISCNARHSDGSIIPEINFAVPWVYVKRMLNKEWAWFARTDVRLSKLWALEPVGLDRPRGRNASPPNTTSRFAQLLDGFIKSRL